jgi:NADPH-dependent ferric siderophore reductase
MCGGILPTAGAWLLIGDDAALPFIRQLIGRLTQGAEANRIIVLAEAATGERPAFGSEVTVHWVNRDADSGPRTLNDALKALFLPQNALRAWVSCEAHQATLIREQLIDDHGVHPTRIEAFAW